MKKQVKRLALNRETLRHLVLAPGEVVGGIDQGGGGEDDFFTHALESALRAERQEGPAY